MKMTDEYCCAKQPLIAQGCTGSITPVALNNVEKETKMPDSGIGAASLFSETEIKAIEKVLSRDLPEDYRQFVRDYGGAFVGVDRVSP
jgi:hypothetical protein